MQKTSISSNVVRARDLTRCKVVSCGTDRRQRRSQFVRQPGRKLQLQSAHRPNTLTGENRKCNSRCKNCQNSKTDHQIPSAKLIGEGLKGTRVVFRVKFPAAGFTWRGAAPSELSIWRAGSPSLTPASKATDSEMDVSVGCVREIRQDQAGRRAINHFARFRICDQNLVVRATLL